MKITIKSSYVKANEDVKSGDIVKLLDEGNYKNVEIQGKRKEVLQFQLELPNGEAKTYSMNVTTQRNLIEEWGDDSRTWVRKDLKVWIVNQLSFGKMINVLILTPEDWTKPTKEETGEVIPVVEDEEREPEDTQIPEEDQNFPF